MHLSILLALSAGALTLAFPMIGTLSAAKQAPPPPTVHHTTANIAAYSNGNCTSLAGPQLDLKLGSCVKIGPTPKDFFMGMDYVDFDILQAFSDDSCQVRAMAIPAPTQPMFKDIPSAAELCLNPQQGFNGPWKSAMAISDRGRWNKLINAGGGPGSPVANDAPGTPYVIPGSHKV